MAQVPASLYNQARSLEQQIGAILAAIDADSLSSSERQLLSQLKHLIVDARLDVRDYDYAETRAEQQARAQDACQRFEQLEKAMLAASEYNIFSAIEIAQLSAVLQHIVAQLT